MPRIWRDPFVADPKPEVKVISTGITSVIEGPRRGRVFHYTDDLVLVESYPVERDGLGHPWRRVAE